jgi:phage/plasmid primase-like uncharacterized protein
MSGTFEQAVIASGLRPRLIVPDGHLRRCATETKPHTTNGWYVLHADGHGSWGDWGTGSGDALGHWPLDRSMLSPTRRQVAPPPRTQQQHERLSLLGWQLWNECREFDDSARGTTPYAYIGARNGVIPPADGALRWHPRLKHGPSGKEGPALVARIDDALTGEAISVHRTWVNGDGTKAPLSPARMLLGGHRKAGGVIKLWPDEYVTHGLAIGEGIETCLSLAHAFRPVWSCIDAGNLAAFPVLPGIESLVIAADNDPAGIKAAHECAERWTRAGREVFLVKPERERADLNDLAKEAA